jgi:hypothetical protein
MLLALLATLSGLGLLAAGGPWRPPVGLGLGLAGVLGLERVIAGARAARRFRDPAGWWFGPVHLLRDVAWAAAIGMWAGRRLLGRRSRPADSMRVLPGPAPAAAPPVAVAPSPEETGGRRGDGSRRRGPLVA